MGRWLLIPPIAFVIILSVSWAFLILLSRLSYKAGKRSAGQGKAYACGEDNYDPMSQPDYSNFFPYAFFFALAHVATLIMTTVPTENLRIFVLAAIYVAGAALGLYILFRK